MPLSDDFGFDDDDTAFITVATQVEASQNVDFNASPRPAKRRRINGPRQLDGAGSEEINWSETDEEAHSPPEQPQNANIQRQAKSEHEREPEEDGIDPDYYFPGELEGADDQPAKKSKYKIHIPKDGGQFKDQIFTQTQVGLDSSPSEFRGAVWKRPPPAPPPPPLFDNGVVNDISRASNRTAFNGARGSGSGPRQTTLNGINGFGIRANAQSNKDDAELAARLQAEENAMLRRVHGVTRTQPIYANKPSQQMSNELADLPSDAFSSSSPEKSPDKDVITISSQPTASQPQARVLRGPQHGLKQMTIFGQPATQDVSASQAAKKKHAWPLKSRDEPPTHHALDEKAMETWVYPTNLGTIRDYQYNIVSRSLFHNTLVALPTGLGKTFIAATVMLNYYRWAKNAHIVFMAPTKPLIAQQMEACYHIVGIPRKDTVLMTGETTPGVRAEEWLERRVFFMTPQTVINDLKTGICDPKKIVLVVVDEAHKASGGYAYTEVVKFLRRFNNSFRVHALTATPGSTVEAVQGVIDALGIARVELRTEQSLDIRPYTHEKHTETELFEYSDEQALIMDLFSKALRPAVEKLCQQNGYWSRDPMALHPYGLNKARSKWALSDAGRKAPGPLKGMMAGLFNALSSLAHSIGLLKNHGIGPFYSGVIEFQRKVDSGELKGKYATEIAQSEHFIRMMSLIRGWTNNPDFIGHPKLQYLREVVLNHFLDTGEGMQGPNVPPSATRVMVFASYRDSTEDICRVLKRNEPMIRPHVFVGQTASKESEGMNQKRQNEVIQDFKSGKYNTLVATSIGEEGLDIGDVDLIVCYDASASPIRMLQRIGRTGRKRVGRVTLLLMKGKEENDYAKAQDNYSFIQKTIADANKYTYHDEQSPRILPKSAQPVVDKRVIEIPIENSQPIDLNEKGRRARGKGKVKRPPKKFHMPDGVRTGFTRASRMDVDSEDDSENEPAPKKKAPAKKKATIATPRNRPANLEPEPVQLPFLEDVLLNSVQQKELERKYAHAADDDADIVIQAPDPSRYPETLRRPGPTKYIRHSNASEAVQKVLMSMKDINDEKITEMQSVEGFKEFLSDAGPARIRLVSPDVDIDESEDELPEDPIPIRKTKGTTATKGSARKKPAAKRKLSARSATTVDVDDTNDSPAAKKPRGRPPKKPVQRATSYGSAAAEGDESSPEPTPANMRIGTQGIDLGTMDTSGEDEDEEPDSELDEFIVRSDQPIEMASSSQRLSDDTQPSNPVAERSRGLKNGATKTTTIMSDTASDESDVGLRAMTLGSEDDSSEVEELSVPVAKATTQALARKRRVINESDSDE